MPRSKAAILKTPAHLPLNLHLLFSAEMPQAPTLMGCLPLSISVLTVVRRAVSVFYSPFPPDRLHLLSTCWKHIGHFLDYPPCEMVAQFHVLLKQGCNYTNVPFSPLNMKEFIWAWCGWLPTMPWCICSSLSVANAAAMRI